MMFDIEYCIRYKDGQQVQEGSSINDLVNTLFGYYDLDNIKHMQNRLQSLQALIFLGLLNQDLGMPISIQNIMKSKNIDKMIIFYKYLGWDSGLDANLFPIIMYYDSAVPTAAKSGPVEVVVGTEANATWQARRAAFRGSI